MLRVPRSGGTPRIVGYPNVDSTVWTANENVQPLERVLGFDQDAGLIATVTARNQPSWIDLHLGDVLVPTRNSLTDLVSADGSTIFGVGADGAVVRLTPSGNWVYKPPQAARAVFPQPSGGVVALLGRGDAARIIRLRPPGIAIVDSLRLPDVRAGAGAPLGDRIYFVSQARRLTGVRARTFTVGGRITFDHTIAAVAATPSGDRFYVITDSSQVLSVVDPYHDRIAATIELPGRPRDLRADPVGRFMLVRAAIGDSAWIVSVGTNTLVSTVRTAWRGDLPLIAPDGAVVLAAGPDVTFVDPVSRRETRRVAGGASDFWYAFVWTGFRQHTIPIDTLATQPANTDTTSRSVASPRADTVAARAAPPIDSTKLGFTVSFAALLDESKARDAAAKITVDGQTARVAKTMTDGTPVYRVVLGPYSTRDDADRIGRESGASYYVYAGPP
ncbi:MAG TPA: SPOR domain-containing protein [Gemmatimonadaceae bacterium]|jgi:hypothetical protein|nr:SPOR domain-containing protein [Gemmatimonadaceae bacterium]